MLKVSFQNQPWLKIFKSSNYGYIMRHTFKSSMMLCVADIALESLKARECDQQANGDAWGVIYWHI